MLRSLFFVSCLLFLNEAAFAASTLPTGRKVYSTLIRARQEYIEPSVNCAIAGLNRLAVSLKNVSNVPQTVTVTYQDLQSTAEILAATPALGATYWPGWTVNPMYDRTRGKIQTYPDTSQTVTLGPMGAAQIIYQFICDYQNAQTCRFTNTDVALTANNNVSGGGAFTTAYSIKLEVAEDRGAVLADLHSQTALNFCTYNADRSETRPFNGGRPF